MNPEQLHALLHSIAARETSVDEAARLLRGWPSEDLGFARLDHQRAARCGFPEVVFGRGKTPAQLTTIFERLAATGQNVLATRVGSRAAAAVAARFEAAQYNRAARTLTLRQRDAVYSNAKVAIVSAGTADARVAEEAAVTCDIFDIRAERFADCGVAGLHRLLSRIEQIRTADVVLAIAGMEGALPSVVGGLVSSPVIAVPTSIGVGAHFQGLTPLLTMLNSCAAGVSVVNVDNGFGAAYQAAMICRALDRAAKQATTPTAPGVNSR
ncbi:MAG: nickel pincer cofactor biosynthesis protein LarB [Phycisphaerae bacterium]|nr:nickel pincer cofactor biosynthesis protein LarB [Phycisphaerae bacterium]